MADLVVRDGIGYKRRDPWGVWLLTIVTLGIYHLVWYYKINNELRNHGQTNNPTVALLAIVLGWIVVVPVFVTLYRTADRIRQAQEVAGSGERMIPILGLLLMFISLIAPAGLPYYQTQINKAWDAEVERGAEVLPA